MADREHKKDVLVAVYDPMIPVAPILDHLREVGVEEEAMEVVSPLPLPGALFEKSVHVSLYLITIIAGLVGIAVGIFFAGGTAAFYPLMTGGKAIVAPPVVGIVSYETMMLLGIVVTFLIMVMRILFAAGARLEHIPELEDGLIGVGGQVDRH